MDPIGENVQGCKNNDHEFTHRNLNRRFDPSRGGQRSFECPGCPGGELYRGADLGGVFFDRKKRWPLK